MKKYAMIPINTKVDENGNRLVRRVLVSYLFKTHKKASGFKNLKVATYHGTKFIFSDAYFTEDNPTHKYIFENKKYKLYKVEGSPVSILYTLKSGIYEKRTYHGVDDKCGTYPAFYPYVIEIKAKNDQEAIEAFNARGELR